MLDPPSRLAMQRRLAREALALSCEASGVSRRPFEKDAHNVPQPFDGIYWSLSHKPHYVAAVVSRHPVGIDIEEITPRDAMLYEYVAEEAEWALAGEQNWEIFFRFWTAKEAVLKATGVGLKDLKKARVEVVQADRLIVQYDGRRWPVQHYRFGHHLVSLTHDGEIRWTLLEDPSSSAF